MKFVQVEGLPMKRNKHNLKAYWEEFMSMDAKTVKAELGVNEYSSPNVARSVWISSIKRFGYPIDVRIRGKDIYLVRRDI